MSDIYECCNTCIHRNKSMWSAVCEPCCGGVANNYVNAKRIEAEELIKKIKQLEPLNNSDCPEWVINIIKGESNERIRKD